MNLTGLGLASLAETAQRAEGAGIRIVAMTESRVEGQILRSLAIPADLYVRKPVDLRAVADVVRKVDDLALLVVRSGPQRTGIDRP